MASVLDVVKLLRTNLPKVTFYPLEFPIDSPDDAACIEVYGQGRASAGVANLQLDIRIRASHPASAEAIHNDITDFLDKKTNFILGDVQVVLVETTSPMPLYAGRDGSSRYLYSSNFTLITNKGV
jgi:hypothetical protein